MRSLPTPRRLSLFVTLLRACACLHSRVHARARALSLLPLPTSVSAQINVLAHLHVRQVYVLAFLGRGALPWDVDGIQDFAWYTRIPVRVYVCNVCVHTCMCVCMCMCK